MDHFTYREGVLNCDEAAASGIAERFETPLYVYSRRTLTDHYDRFAEAFREIDPLICFSVKACPNLHLCRLLAERGSGFDVVSGGELFRALRAGADPRRIVFAGVGKSPRELREALSARIGLLNIESASELETLVDAAREARLPVEAAVRVNPDVDAHTHAYTTTGRKENKFGLEINRAVEMFRTHPPDSPVRLRGLHLHIGSPVNRVDRYQEAAARGLELIAELRQAGHEIDVLDLGGGFGAHYAGGEAPPAAAYAQAIVPLLRDAGLRIVLEPGRSIAANAGILLTRVLHVKESDTRRFIIVDASMNELIRPALYGAYHFVWPVRAGDFVPATRGPEQPFDGLAPADVVGPVCESADFIARQRPLPPVRRGDLLAVFSTGAYAMSMASQYNSRPRAAEVLVDGAAVRLIRRRESYEDLLACEAVESPDGQG